MVDQHVRVPDLSARSYELTVERVMTAPPALLYLACTQGFDIWLADPQTVRLRPAAGEPFYFETVHDTVRTPHYGRFVRLETGRLIEFTWVATGELGTEGAETVVRMEFVKQPRGIRIRLHHSGFTSEAARDRYRAAWPEILARLDSRTAVTA